MTDARVLAAIRTAAPAGAEITTDDLFSRLSQNDTKLSISLMLNVVDRLESAGSVITYQAYVDGIVKRFVYLSPAEVDRKPDPIPLEEAFDYLVDKRL